ncbi:MAG: YdcF family protein [Opitutales bacterium]
MSSDPRILIVLGSPNRDDGGLYAPARARCEEAWRQWSHHPDWLILLTGGYGEHFNRTARPHAAYLQDALRVRGIPAEAFLPFAESLNTLEDAALAKPIALASGLRAATVITSDYHLARARYVFQREFRDTGLALEFVGTPTDESAAELDYAALKAHEAAALERLQRADNPSS